MNKDLVTQVQQGATVTTANQAAVTTDQFRGEQFYRADDPGNIDNFKVIDDSAGMDDRLIDGGDHAGLQQEKTAKRNKLVMSAAIFVGLLLLKKIL